MKQFSDLVGKTIIRTEGEEGASELKFILDDGSSCRLVHYQDCCEIVYIESIVGDLNDLLYVPILRAEESNSASPDLITQITNRLAPPPEPEGFDDPFTWTFYKLATIKGYVDVRWYSSSSGYYSESIDFEFLSES